MTDSNSATVEEEYDADRPLVCASNTNVRAANLPDCNDHQRNDSDIENYISNVQDSALEVSASMSKSYDLMADSEVPPIPKRDPVSRLLSSCSIASEGALCPICLDPMTPIDHEHPLQCPTRHCHYNFCSSCVESLLSSSKDDFEVASDGSKQVKVYLHCPNCRADLSTSIRDVLLLRKVDTVDFLLQQGNYSTDTDGNNKSKESVLNPSQKRTLAAMQELHVQEAVQRARIKEKEFWKMHYKELQKEADEAKGDMDAMDVSSTSLRISRRRMSQMTPGWRLGTVCSACSGVDDDEQSYRDENDTDTAHVEEWGVEADLLNGVHSSIRLPEDQKFKFLTDPDSECKGEIERKPVADETLLQGLESCMTHAEQLKACHLMTTGDADSLAEAARIMQKIDQDTRRGILPSSRQQMMNRRASVYAIVEETRKINQQQQKGVRSPSDQSTESPGMPHLSRQRQEQFRRATEHRKLEMAMIQRASLLERSPLPVRMPKAITLDLIDPTSRDFPLRFCDDNWDGTILDAYTRLNVAPERASSTGWKINKKAQTQHPGVFHVLSEGKYENHFGPIELSATEISRVVVASVQGRAGQQGIMKGDVVTHIDGSVFMNGRTVDDLIGLLQSKIRDGQSSFEMVLNAEVSIAKALKRRSKVMQ